MASSHQVPSVPVHTSPSLVPVPNATSSIPLTSSSCSIGKISNSDIEDEVKYWSTTVACYVTSANSPLQVVEGFVKRI